MHHLMGEGVLSANATFDYISHCVSTRLEPSLFPYRPLVSFALQYFKRPVGLPRGGGTRGGEMAGGGETGMGGRGPGGHQGARRCWGCQGGAGGGGFRGFDLWKMQGGGGGVLGGTVRGPMLPSSASGRCSDESTARPPLLPNQTAHDRELREQAEGGGDQVRHPSGASCQRRQHRRVGAMVGEGGERCRGRGRAVQVMAGAAQRPGCTGCR